MFRLKKEVLGCWKVNGCNQVSANPSVLLDVFDEHTHPPRISLNESIALPLPLPLSFLILQIFHQQL